MTAPTRPTDTRAVRVVRRYVDEFLSGGDVAVATELAHEDIRVHQLGADVERSGRALNVKHVQSRRDAVPDFELVIDEVFEGDTTVTVRATATGTPEKPWGDLVPTGDSFAVPVVYVFRVVDGRIVEQWTLTDRLGVTTQLGLCPPTVRGVVAVLKTRLFRTLRRR